MADATNCEGAHFLLFIEPENTNMKTTKSLVAASFALILLAACGSTGMGDILGGGGTNQQSNYEIRGTVESVDVNSRSIYLTNVSGYTSMLSNGGNSVRVYYDDRTPVDFNGQSYRPSDLERGDQVSVRVDESGNDLKASSVTVTRDVSSGTGSYPSGSYESTIRGTVRNVDTVRRTIELESTSWISGYNSGSGSGTRTIISYDTNIGVDVNGRTESVSGLERGDIVEVRVTRDANNSTLWAQRLVLVRDVNSR